MSYETLLLFRPMRGYRCNIKSSRIENSIIKYRKLITFGSIDVIFNNRQTSFLIRLVFL